MHGRVVSTEVFDSLVPILRQRGHVVVGPTLRENTITYDVLDSAADLPIGWTDVHGPATYTVKRRDDDAYFGYVVGPRNLKRYLFPPRQTLLTIRSANSGLEFLPEPLEETSYAFIGVRACELAGMEIQDRVFGGPPFADPGYVSRRQNSFTVAVNCSIAGETCFCDSMGTGPRCDDGYDLVVTEFLDDGTHEFLVQAGSSAGEEVLAKLEGRDASREDMMQGQAIVDETIAHRGRSRAAEAAHDILADNLEHPIWDEIADRCLSCTNCTLVCPTCFCSTVEDVTDLEGSAHRERRWDACFNREFTYLHGRPVRYTTRSRFRLWMTHKLSWWFEQFGSSGCVGCGRCITWCPAGIDITEEVARFQEETAVMA